MFIAPDCLSSDLSHLLIANLKKFGFNDIEAEPAEEEELDWDF